jgi:predicted Rossmann fold flavoprotein
MIVVVGAGAAGLAAAVFARSNNQPVMVLERTTDGGRKILISGGGRCNVLPQTLEPRRFVTDSPPALVQKFLRSWPLKAQHAFIEKDVGVPLKLEAESRKWFPASDRARDVRDGWVELARRKGVAFSFGTDLVSLTRLSESWRLTTSRGDIAAHAVILATGGLSVPTTGSTGTGLTIARALGHVVHDTYPALTPLLSSRASHTRLAGVSLNVIVRASSTRDSAESSGGFLFTHRGYSGPSVLDVSHVAVRTPGAALRVRWSALDARQWQDALVTGTALVVNVIGRHLPQRLAEELAMESDVPIDRRVPELRREERTRLIERLLNYELVSSGDEGYKKAEVTGGGVALDEVDPKTLESRRHAGLFLCGEMLDAFGPIGGHNFAWAWATGRMAGLGASTMGALRI